MPNQASVLKTLHEKHSLIRDRVRAVSLGHANGIYIHGRGGTAKTYLVRTTLEQLGQRYTYSNGHLTEVGFFDLIAENPESTVVLDDVSTLFEKPKALQLLLAALGTPHDGSRTRPVRYKKAGSDEVVFFQGSIIAISNLSLSGHSNEVLQALQDRIHVLAYEPTDEEIEAQIFELAGKRPRGVETSDAVIVAEFVLAKCRELGVRPSLRLFLDKALPDFRLWNNEDSELHWHDLVHSSIKQLVVEPGHELRDMTRKDQVTAERKLVAYLCEVFCTPTDQVREWQRRTNKSKSAFYRRKKEVEATLGL
jgi:hypothetical protein